MKRFLIVLIIFLAPASAQRPPVHSPLLDHLVGNWVLQGAIAGKQTTHDITAEWVANHQYLRLHEVSREKNADGTPQYDAFIHIGWNEPSKTYSILWLDNFWGIEPESIGAASPKANELLFLWKDANGAATFSNDFLYDPRTDSWLWTMDNIVDNIKKPFGTVKLVRAGAPAQLSPAR